MRMQSRPSASFHFGDKKFHKRLRHFFAGNRRKPYPADDIYSAAVWAIYALNTEAETVGRESW